MILARLVLPGEVAGSRLDHRLQGLALRASRTVLRLVWWTVPGRRPPGSPAQRVDIRDRRGPASSPSKFAHLANYAELGNIADNLVFTMQANQARTEKDMIEAAVAWLRESVPADWSVGPASRAGASSSEGVEADAAVDVTASNGTGTTIVMEAKRTFEPRDAERLLGGIGRTLRALSAHIPILVVAPWLSERSRSLLREEGINYFDLSGNAELKLDHPALYIKMTGAAKDPTRATRNKARGQGKKAGRLIRILADTQPPYRVTDLAEASDLAPGYVSRLLEAFSDEALIDRSGRGAVEAVDVAGLLRRWVETYDVLTTNYSTPFLAAAGAKATLQRLPDLSTRFAVTGSFAAVRLAPVAGPALLAVYCDNTDSVAASLSLVPTDSGANVVLLKPFDPVVWTGLAFDDAGIAYCAPSQVAVDCLTGNGRMPPEGEAVLEWMSKNELAWRRPTLSTSQDQ